MIFHVFRWRIATKCRMKETKSSGSLKKIIKPFGDNEKKMLTNLVRRQYGGKRRRDTSRKKCILSSRRLDISLWNVPPPSFLRPSVEKHWAVKTSSMCANILQITCGFSVSGKKIWTKKRKIRRQLKMRDWKQIKKRDEWKLKLLLIWKSENWLEQRRWTMVIDSNMWVKYKKKSNSQSFLYGCFLCTYRLSNFFYCLLWKSFLKHTLKYMYNSRKKSFFIKKKLEKLKTSISDSFFSLKPPSKAACAVNA